MAHDHSLSALVNRLYAVINNLETAHANDPSSTHYGDDSARCADCQAIAKARVAIERFDRELE